MIYMEKEIVLNLVADNIRLERLRKKYTQEKLAELSGISQKYLNLIEKGKVNPTILVIIKLCQILKIDLNTIYQVENT